MKAETRRIESSALDRACQHLARAHANLEGSHPTLSVSVESAQSLLTTAIVEAAGHDERVVWTDLDCELLVRPGRTRVELREGLVLVTLSVHTDQTGDTEVLVPFAVGTPDEAAGLLAATERTPRGPTLIVERWGEALIALAWKALLTMVERLALATTDRRATFSPAALVASRRGLGLILARDGDAADVSR